MRALRMAGELDPFPRGVNWSLRGGRCGLLFHCWLVSQNLERLGAADSLDFRAKLLIRPDPSGHIQNNREVPGPFEPQPDSCLTGLSLEESFQRFGFIRTVRPEAHLDRDQ